MAIDLPASLEERLKQIAIREGRDLQSLLTDPRFGAALQEALRQTWGLNGPHSAANGAHEHSCETPTPRPSPTPQDIADGLDDESFSKPSPQYPMRGRLSKYIDPCEPVFPADDWEAMR